MSGNGNALTAPVFLRVVLSHIRSRTAQAFLPTLVIPLFLLGVCLMVWMPTLPDVSAIYGVPVFIVLLILLLSNWQFRLLLVLPLAVVAGGVWLLLYVQHWSVSSLPEVLEGKTLMVTGQIVSIPRENARRSRFDFRIDSLDGEQWTGKVRISWYHPEHKLFAGQRWQLAVKLKRPHGFSNPGGFDYEAWLYRHGTGATGYVRKTHHAKFLTQEKTIDYYRQQLVDRIRSLGLKQQEIILALAVGERQDIDSKGWQVLTRTGTNHLLAISGLHIGLVYALFFWMGRRLWSQSSRLCLQRPAPDVGMMVGWVFALVYAAMAGFSIPTQRVMVMLTVVVVMTLLRRYTSSWNLLLLALLAVLLLEPLAVLAAGFWLSFAAVAIILMTLQGEEGGLWLSRLFRVQLYISIGLIPLLIILFNQFSLVSPLANLFAVPWVSVMIVPFVLLAVLSLNIWSGLAALILQLVSWSIDILWWVLSWLAETSAAVIHVPAMSAWIMLLLVAAVVVLLMACRWRWRVLALAMMIPAFWQQPERPAVGDFMVDFLDVGQGLSVVVRTHRHTLLYDTGFSNHTGFDIGRLVVIPYLRDQGISHLDTVIISHHDKDHVGGLPTILGEIEVGRLLVGEADSIRQDSLLAQGDTPVASRCFAGQQWQYDGVQFEILSPPERASSYSLYKGNNLSCVVRISNGVHQVLLTGDIEKKAEQYLLAHARKKLPSTIMLVPHHGSKTSSTDQFIHAVSPSQVVYTVGYRNRFGFPRPAIRQRYEAHRALQWRSDWHGMLRMHIGHHSEAIQVTPHRFEHRRFWHNLSVGKE